MGAVPYSLCLAASLSLSSHVLGSSKASRCVLWHVSLIAWPCYPSLPCHAQGNTVAVKMLKVKEITPTQRIELRREALAMFEKPHPCVATIYGG